ncbi:MAG: hypothetical protein EBY96_04870, partial [Actinobacteria bacterium]|nr:hypothetical protein [Actinomycetota bacterium]
MAKRRPPTTNGFVVIDKPAGMTSHDVVAKLRKRFNEKRVGHAGTLDPDATGVLLVGVGYVTRLMSYLSGMSKSYVGERDGGHVERFRHFAGIIERRRRGTEHDFADIRLGHPREVTHQA